ncbi:peritrophin-44-like [Phlebotomus papatasi]|uniref:Chitin-binding type-2 domain-containing protein n=1 Tax=Phlebotomus papatasi TaxID=29031 RepID=A0A1B0DLW5_PHLPP|nr:peritrophin-44-like [Phlebotomus papatasi]
MREIKILICGLFVCIFSITPLSTQDVDLDEICQGMPNGTYVPDPLACESFYLCLTDEPPRWAECPNDYWFNPDTAVCDLQENVDCVHVTTEPPTTTTTTTTTTTVATTTWDPDIEPGIYCPSQDNPFTILFLQSFVDCGTYYICYHGRPHRFQCVSGMYWNPFWNQCDYPQNTHCQINPNPFPVCPRNGLSIFPHPDECDSYIYCLNGEPSIQKCPFYHHWDIGSQSCMLRDRARCVSD